ncbi:MAG: IclR family transcriptional regulator [Caldilineaceae bacterium]|nr:IclR family transcriptional regulator [Caldilineaceae bacterium]
MLRAMAQAERPLTLSELSKLTGGSRSTIYNTLATLQTHGLVQKDLHYKTYRLGVAIFELGNAYLNQVHLVPAFYEQARRLVALCGETVKLVILDHRDVVYLAKQEGSYSVRLVAKVGTRMPAHITAVGKVLLAQLDESTLRSLYADYGFGQGTVNAAHDLEDLLARLEPVRRQGYAYDIEESTAGVRCVAAPVRDHSGEVIAAMSIGIPTERLLNGQMDELTGLIAQHAQELSRTLGWLESGV